VQEIIRTDTPLSKAEAAKAQLASLLSLEPIRIEDVGLFSSDSLDPHMLRSLEELQKNISESSQKNNNISAARDVVVGFSLSLTAGYLVWMLRGGTLLARMFSVSPMWKQLDPLPILNGTKDGEDFSDEEDQVESLFQSDAER